MAETGISAPEAPVPFFRTAKSKRSDPRRYHAAADLLARPGKLAGSRSAKPHQGHATVGRQGREILRSTSNCRC